MKKFLPKLLSVFKKLVLFFFISTILVVILYRFVMPPLTPLMVIRYFEQIINGKEVRFKREYVTMEEISTNLPRAVMASEDQKFAEHYGFDIEAIEKAYKNNQKGRKKSVKGGSTISQQVAKNVFLWPGRSYVRKGFEAYFTLLIEIIWSKERIMEVYLNVIEMGNGIYGAEAAARLYFKKPAYKLSKKESALIAAILPNPRKWSPVRPTAYLNKRQIWIMYNMNNINMASVEK
jgi:monofunctional biosynthetic peptidoglycan transglycosylase